ncbi:1-(5-phosphoribosyl)-5-[(5-phosphoribosylamino)methylideneamino] imidazole-4-carboxamide isomerase [Campylobacter sp.]|uniref:1-(5-phosphoribosyl)-5-[(5- phosphoribosylamino)methylideneamino] imidazole-4-carboxamide isomerase n=1 Tax=Campylobacter sp. TaxID=205 RepID=UPI0026DB7C31|nr:1-(5-phosphoribosyl)-5-[(5-phosphoribosylamino)methylideneamino] imidazole-4-carboxamide isomerase [Campylobacter sp.]MDO4674859.1 1-(5-phosphoribosyl)-5-[(5-phosphoribosylamino)methylideneamino] imidazole-4-carboxamide isomerase [Campylobacter sp.]
MQTKLIPALDLIEGKVVRLLRGDYAQRHDYELDALETLKAYEKMGAKDLHLVDLTGAKDPKKRQFKLLQTFAQELKANLQVGGGIRTKEEISALFKSGVGRVVLGSLTVQRPEFCVELLREWGAERFCFALDVSQRGDDFFIAINAWQEVSEKQLFPTLEFYAKEGLKHILCTDISKDGTMSGVNVALYQSLGQNFPHMHIQASGGVAGLEDLEALRGKCAGVIVGKALLDGVFSVKEGIAYLKGQKC